MSAPRRPSFVERMSDRTMGVLALLVAVGGAGMAQALMP